MVIIATPWPAFMARDRDKSVKSQKAPIAMARAA
jgi:hypothetical protein